MGISGLQAGWKGRELGQGSRVAIYSCVFLPWIMVGTSACYGQLQSLKLNPFEKPKVSVTIPHPAARPLNLHGKRLALEQTGGNCAQELEDEVSKRFESKGITLINRSDLDTILHEQRFQSQSSVDPAEAVRMGRLLGPAVMAFIQVTRCISEKTPLNAPQAIPPGYISKTQVHLRGSVRMVDLTTGADQDTLTIHADPVKQNFAQQGYPEYPSASELEDEAIRVAADQVERRYFPWNEPRQVSFMNGKDCNLRQAYELLKANDLDGALSASQQSVELCKSSSKVNHQADAWYNLGIMYFLKSKYNDALDALGKAQRLHSDRTVIEALSECREAKRGANDIPSTQPADPAPGPIPGPGAAPSEQATTPDKDTLTNGAIMDMVKGGLPADLVLKMIATRPARFSTSPQDLLALKKAGVPNAVISAMLDKH